MLANSASYDAYFKCYLYCIVAILMLCQVYDILDCDNRDDLSSILDELGQPSFNLIVSSLPLTMGWHW